MCKKVLQERLGDTTPTMSSSVVLLVPLLVVVGILTSASPATAISDNCENCYDREQDLEPLFFVSQSN